MNYDTQAKRHWLLPLSLTLQPRDLPPLVPLATGAPRAQKTTAKMETRVIDGRPTCTVDDNNIMIYCYFIGVLATVSPRNKSPDVGNFFFYIYIVAMTLHLSRSGGRFIAHSNNTACIAFARRDGRPNRPDKLYWLGADYNVVRDRLFCETHYDAEYKGWRG